MVDVYKKEANIKSPISVRFNDKRVTPAAQRTLYNRKTGEIIKNELVFNAKHFQIMAKTSLKDTKIYLKRTVAHEIGHMKQIEDDFDKAKRSYIGRGIPNSKVEDEADRYSRKFTKISESKLDVALKNLQRKYDEQYAKDHPKKK
jgi:hypothetical protein